MLLWGKRNKLMMAEYNRRVLTRVCPKCYIKYMDEAALFSRMSFLYFEAQCGILNCFFVRCNNAIELKFLHQVFVVIKVTSQYTHNANFIYRYRDILCMSRLWYDIGLWDHLDVYNTHSRSRWVKIRLTAGRNYLEI